MDDLTKYEPTPNNWFEKTVDYIGEGKAEFSNPKGWIKGDTTVTVDVSGKISIIMEVKDYKLDNSEDSNYAEYDAIRWLLSGRKPYNNGQHNFHIITINNATNFCKTVHVTTADGDFTALDDEIHYQYDLSEVYRVKFQVQGEFGCNNSNDEKYWIMPLSNFIHDSILHIPFYYKRHPLDFHPLRTKKIAKVSTDLPQDELKSAIIYSNRQNSFIPFVFAEKWGFIEILNDYSETKKKITSGNTRILTTSVMVGDCDNNSIKFNEIFDWLPLDSLHVLSLVSGSMVGIPWIEIRDEDGNLVKRIHTRQWQGKYSKGHSSIYHGIEVGSLLSNASKKLPSVVRNSLRLAVKSSSEQYILNDRLVFLFIALDSLTQYYRKSSLINSLDEPQKSIAESILNKYEHSQSIQYDAHTRELVESILKTSMNQIRKFGEKLKADAQLENDVSEKERLEYMGDDIINRVSQSVRQALNNRRHQPDESEAILLLLKEYGFNDPHVIENHYLGWINDISKYRNQMVHEGYFKISTGEHDISKIAPIYNHLLDILIRVLLKKLNYQGKYIPAIPKRQRLPLDWVQPNMSLAELGY